MLLLGRRRHESIIIPTSDGPIRVTLIGLRGDSARIGVEAPDDVGIYRDELPHPGGGTWGGWYGRVTGEEGRDA